MNSPKGSGSRWCPHGPARPASAGGTAHAPAGPEGTRQPRDPLPPRSQAQRPGPGRRGQTQTGGGAAGAPRASGKSAGLNLNRQVPQMSQVCHNPPVSSGCLKTIQFLQSPESGCGPAAARRRERGSPRRRPVSKLPGPPGDARATGTAPATEPVPPSRSSNRHLPDVCPETCPSLVSSLSAASRVSRRPGTSPARGRPGFATAQPLGHLVPLTGDPAQLSLIAPPPRRAQVDGAGPAAGTLRRGD